MSEEKKTFKVVCVACGRPFHIRYPLAAPNAQGEGEVLIRCQYCSQDIMVTLPRKYIEAEHLDRGLKSMRVRG